MAGEARRWIVGVDGSEHGPALLERVRGLAAPDDVIEVVHAWDLPMIVGYDLGTVIDPSDLELAGRNYVDGLVADSGDPRVSGRVARGHAGHVLAQETRDGTVVAVGHRGSGRMSMLLGSTASYVLHHAAVPVLVDRGQLSTPVRRVLVGVDDHDLVDGENESVRALRWAYSVPGVESVTVAHATFLPVVVGGWYADLVADMEALDSGAMRAIESVIEVAGEPPRPIGVERVPLRGKPGLALADASREFDLLVVGSRGRGAWRELVLGSTSAVAASYAHCPVVVIR
ncbi:MAG: universal stress protein [Ilumatobacteraceae bacterium]